MTEKEKEKAYDEAIERAKKSYGNGIAEEIFPELYESEDEMIKTAILNLLKIWRNYKDYVCGVHVEDAIAWLEKQGKNSADKIEPRFKVGDWVIFTTSGNLYQVEKKENYEYTLRNIFGGSLCLSFSKEELIREWTIQDARDGDVLFFYSEYKSHKMTQVGIIEKYVGKHGGCSNTFKIYVGVNWDNNLQIGKYMGCSNIHPATKEQYDALMKAMNDAGYKWNAGTKTLEKLEKSSFHEGDWVVYNNDICQIVKREEGCNKLVTVFGIEKELVNERNLSTTRLWTIQDAKVGDVLEFGDHGRLVIGILSGINKTTGKVDVSCLLEDNKFKLGVFYNLDTVSPHPAIKEQRDILMKAMNDAGYKWNTRTKTLEKLVEPKFKVGDKIVNLPMKYMGGSWTQGTISKITDDKYIFTDGSYTSISSQDSWELVYDKKPKFDPKTLKPFDKVLVRDDESLTWKTNMFSYIDNNKKYPYVCLLSCYRYCIPYNDDTKHLVGTSDEAPEFYRYWED